MDKQKELQFPLRNYFVYMFCSVLVTTSIIALMTVFVLKNWLHVEVSFQSWLLIFSFVIIVVGSLAIVKTIVERLGGIITVESELGKGSVFQVVLTK